MTTDEYFTHAFTRLIRGWASLEAFRKVSRIGIPASAPIIRRENERITSYLAGRPDFKSFIKSPRTLDKIGGLQGMEAAMTEMALNSAQRSVDAASVVFAHSVVDAAASAFLRVTSMANPADWEQFLNERKGWSVADVRTVGYDRLFRGLLFRELEGIERNWALPRKLSRINQLCRPESDWVLPIKYDEAELTRIDELRHDIVHGDSLAGPIADVEVDLKFLKDIGDYCFVLVHKRYGARLIFYE